ncbi:unnamed protein product [Trichogramma brassicae]|uniref:Uncharacterized protein n=1 Tax=Trichogramma brassicae TaxID=86971 RepID=A0A6H5IR71_9HYME|nr:unnamed protein product [Trichogramma brassicae]
MSDSQEEKKEFIKRSHENYDESSDDEQLEESKRNELMSTVEYAETLTESPFLYLTCDLPPPPLFKDQHAENIIPQKRRFRRHPDSGSQGYAPVHDLRSGRKRRPRRRAQSRHLPSAHPAQGHPAMVRAAGSARDSDFATDDNAHGGLHSKQIQTSRRRRRRNRTTLVNDPRRDRQKKHRNKALIHFYSLYSRGRIIISQRRIRNRGRERAERPSPLPPPSQSRILQEVNFVIAVLTHFPAVDQQPSLRSGRKCRRALPCNQHYT